MKRRAHECQRVRHRQAGVAPHELPDLRHREAQEDVALAVLARTGLEESSEDGGARGTGQAAHLPAETP